MATSQRPRCLGASAAGSVVTARSCSAGGRIAAARPADVFGRGASESMAPRAPASAGWIGVSTEASTTSAMMMVMLSGPPDRSASSTSRLADSAGVPSASASAIVSRDTGSDRPSEHSRYRSPLRTSRYFSVGSTGRPVRALRISDRCGCTDASSAVSDPSSTSDCTYVSSRVICVSSPSRSR